MNAHLVQCCEEAFCGGIPGAAAQLSGTNIIKDEMRATVKFLVRPRIPSSLSKAQVRREEKRQAGVALATEVGSVVLAQ